MKSFFFFPLLLLLFVSDGLSAQRVAAAGLLSTCTETALGAALVAGGDIVFDCSGVITITSTKVIGDGMHVSLDGGTNEVTLDGGGIRQLFSVASLGSLRLANLTLTNGSALQGGAVRNQGSLVVQNSSFRGHVSGDRGGAIGSFGPSASLVIEDSWFESNRGFGGGAVANGSFVGLRGNMSVSRTTFVGNSAEFGGAVLTGGEGAISASVFRDNHATGERGGAIFNGVNLTVRDSRFDSNTARFDGGGIQNSSGAHLRVEGSSFVSNQAGLGLLGSGGAISTLGSTDISGSSFERNSARAGGALASGSGVVSPYLLTVERSRFRANTTTGWGGAVVISGPTTANLVRNLFDRNSADRGGAIAVYPLLGTPVVDITHTVFHRNHGETSAGAIMNYGTMELAFAPLVNNRAPLAGGVENFGQLTMRHVVLGRNEGGDCANAGNLIDGGHNQTLDGSCGL